MSAIVKGRGVFWSVGGVRITAGLTGNPTAMTQSADLSRTAERRNIMDTGGTNQALVYYGGMKGLRFSCVPYASTQALGAAACEAYTPAAGTTVTFADEALTIIPGTWNVVSANQRRNVTNEVVVDMECEASDEGIDLTTDVA